MSGEKKKSLIDHALEEREPREEFLAFRWLEEQLNRGPGDLGGLTKTVEMVDDIILMWCWGSNRQTNCPDTVNAIKHATQTYVYALKHIVKGYTDERHDDECEKVRRSNPYWLDRSAWQEGESWHP